MMHLCQFRHKENRPLLNEKWLATLKLKTQFNVRILSCQTRDTTREIIGFASENS